MTTMTRSHDVGCNRNAAFAAAKPFSEFAAVLLRQRHRDPRIANGGEQLYDCDYMTHGRIADRVHATFPVCQIDRICQVNAPQMYGMYLLRKEEMEIQYSGRPYATEVKELELYHVTTESKGKESLKNGLDWRRTKRSKFGRGVSFSDDVDYADYYANNTSIEDQRRVIIVCAVLVANTWRVANNNKNKRHAGKELIVPPGTSDTTVSPNGRVYVKYYDYEFYPLYMVYYRRRPEHLPLSRYYNNNNVSNVKNRGATPHQNQQYTTLTELEKQKREQQEDDRERRQKEEQLQRHQQMQQQQRERRLQQQRAEQLGRWQSQESERKRREELVRSNWQQHTYQSSGRRSNPQRDNSCLIL